MDAKERAAIETAGHKVCTVKEFLGLTDGEAQLVELRVALSRLVRRLRAKSALTQGELAERAGSSQSRVAKVEAGARGVTLDLTFRCLFAVGGKVEDLAGALTPTGSRAKSAKGRKSAKVAQER